MFPALTHCKNGTANSALKSAETQEHLEVSSALKAACWFPPDITESEQAVLMIRKQEAT